MTENADRTAQVTVPLAIEIDLRHWREMFGDRPIEEFPQYLFGLLQAEGEETGILSRVAVGNMKEA